MDTTATPEAPISAATGLTWNPQLHTGDDRRDDTHEEFVDMLNRLLAKALVRLAPPELVMTEIAIKDLPLYSSDYDADYPPVARALKQAMMQELLTGRTVDLA